MCDIAPRVIGLGRGSRRLGRWHTDRLGGLRDGPPLVLLHGSAADRGRWAAVRAMRGTPAWRARVACAPTLARETRAANAYRPDPARLAAVTTPARFLLGTEATPALTRAARAAHAALPASELRELPGHGHVAMDADPALFVAEAEDWFASAVDVERSCTGRRSAAADEHGRRSSRRLVGGEMKRAGNGEDGWGALTALPLPAPVALVNRESGTGTLSDRRPRRAGRRACSRRRRTG